MLIGGRITYVKLLKSAQAKEGRVWKYLAFMNFTTVAEIFRQFFDISTILFLATGKTEKKELISH